MNKSIYLILLLIFLSCQQGSGTKFKDKKVQQINNYVDSIEGLSGALLIAKNDTILLEKAYGYAHLGHKVKNNINTKFNQGSIGKSFTAVSILQLVQNDKLKLTDPIGKYLSDYPNKTVRDSVTIKHLLSHTSGLPHFFAREQFLNASKDLYRTMDDLTPLYINEPMESKPGELFSYRNTNYVLLGKIIEKISGLKYDDYLSKHIYKPASMTNTGNFDLDHPIENAAEGYTTSEVYSDKFKVNIHTYPSKGNAAGGGYTTLDDLFNFVNALKSHKLLNEEYTRLYTTPFAKDDHYGLGIQFPTPEDGLIYGHSGGHFGVGTEWRYYSNEEYTVILLTNKDTDKGFLEARYMIQKIISGSTTSIDRFFNTKEILDSYYKNGFSDTELKIKEVKGDLNEFDFIMKGYDAIKKRDYNTAIEIFKLGILVFPESADLYDSLGEAYMEANDYSKAILNYEKSLELNPDNENATKMIKQMKAST